MNLLSTLKNVAHSSIHTAQLLSELLKQLNEQSTSVNQRLGEIRDGVANETAVLNERLKAVEQGLANMARDVNNRLDDLDKPQAAKPADPIQAALRRLPFMVAAKTYNANHPDYDATAVRNYPGRIFNSEQPSQNTVYADVKKLASGDMVFGQAWERILDEALDEAKAIPHAHEIFERRLYIEKYMEDLNRAHLASYIPGWIGMEEALFLYWIIRRLNPKVIVQTGVCNGMSSAFMVLALAKNGRNGKLHAIDQPQIFDANNPSWTVRNKIYGCTIPAGKDSGWMVPDAYRDHCDIWTGDAKELLPKMLAGLSSVDMFYHDSDHTYDHMMFEFEEVKKRLESKSVIVADDIAWNSSLWDFADLNGVPSYNFRGSMGVAFF